jgi:predicted GNAT superfamily acetyltransferase
LAGTTQPADQASLTPVNRTMLDSRGLPANSRLRLALRDARLLVEIPTNTDGMRSVDIKLALRWRMETRRIFRHYLSEGYRVEDFVPPTDANHHRAFYVLVRTGPRRG